MKEPEQPSAIWVDWSRLKEKEAGAQLRILEKIKKRKPDFGQILKIHAEVFTEFDCLTCANCCKTARPTFNRTDVKRIARYLGMKEGELEAQYLLADAEGDFVPKEMPCPFLQPDHTCQIYEARPASCRSFPHTDVRDAWNRPKHMARTAQVCPAAFAIIQKMDRSAGLA